MLQISLHHHLEHPQAVAMSLPGPSRNLTLTEELEKLEQSITLTLQEIDHNFSKAHRIVTSSILPLVEQYGEHSKNVWEASKVSVLICRFLKHVGCSRNWLIGARRY